MSFIEKMQSLFPQSGLVRRIGGTIAFDSGPRGRSH